MGKPGQQSQFGKTNRVESWFSRAVARISFRRRKYASAVLASGDRRQSRRLAYEGSYRCPACASGNLSAIALMDVFACDFCRHLFSANLETQSVHLADSLQPMAWRWNGWNWRTAQQSDTAAGIVWAFTVGLTLAPVGIIALSNYVFPPLDSSGFPKAWTVLTLICHSAIALWLLAEYYRWPWYVSGRVRIDRLRERWLAAES